MRMRNSSPSSPQDSSASRFNARPQPPIVAWTIATYRCLLYLCPPTLRRRYGAEMVQVFRQLCRDTFANQGAWGVALLWAPTCRDVVSDALIEYGAEFAMSWREFWMTNRLRASAIMVFCAFIAFVVVGIGYQKMTESVIQSGVQAAHPTLSFSFLLMQVGAVVALLAVLIGGAPLAFAALRYALAAGRRDILALFGVPVVSLIVLAIYFKLVAHLVFAHHPSIHGPTTLDRVYGGALIALFVLAAAVSAWAVSQAILRAKIGDRIMRFTRIPAIIATLAMALMLVATIVWGLGLLANAPQVFNGDDGAFASNTAISWGIGIAVMGIATLVAVIGLTRGATSREADQEAVGAVA